jgi:diguanylate cyclase (GGDEF)-like protein/putative nucleotidyltransferase with HDIG domain
MSLQARAYITAIVVCGLVAFSAAMAQWDSSDLVRFACYLAIAAISSGLKVSLPGVTGTMSVSFLFVLIGVVQLSEAETVVIACLTSLVQVVWHAVKRPTLAQILFNFSNNAIGAAVAHALYWKLPFSPSYGSISPLKLAIASGVYFLINTGTVAGVISLTERRPVRVIWKDCYFWSFPYYLVGASIAALFSYVSNWIGWEILILAVPVIYLIIRSYRLYLGKLESERNHASEMAALHLRTIEALALAIDAKDHSTNDHLQRVQVYALELGRELGLAREEMDALQAASLLHDIGKLAVPEHIISKPGKLTPEEFDKMKIHPIVGAEILERVQFPYPVVPIVRCHHEKWDGTGYPCGLKGEAIPMGARILSAVDFLDALASDRPYRRALPLEEAMRMLISERGRSFDPRVVDVLERRYKDLEHLARTGPRVTTLAALSRDAVVERGKAPAAGFETSSRRDATPERGDFVTSIAAARQEVQGLFELASELGRSLSLQDTLTVIASRLHRMVPHDAVAIYVVRDGVLQAVYADGDESEQFLASEIPVGEGISGWVAGNHKPILNGSPAVEFGYRQDPNITSRLQSALSVPLDGAGGVLGALTLYSKSPNAFERDQLRVLLAISSKLAASVENSLRYEHAESVATTDYLTGLPNARSLFLHLDAEVKRCQRESSSLTVLVCDLDGFKAVNDRFGHLAGNQLLSLVGAGFRDACREYDYVARMGGDEFVIVLPGISEEGMRAKLGVFSSAVHQAGLEVCREPVVAMSVGEACFPGDGQDAEQLLAEADRRMYKNKWDRKMRRSLAGAAQALAGETEREPAR